MKNKIIFLVATMLVTAFINRAMPACIVVGYNSYNTQSQQYNLVAKSLFPSGTGGGCGGTQEVYRPLLFCEKIHLDLYVIQGLQTTHVTQAYMNQNYSSVVLTVYNYDAVNQTCGNTAQYTITKSAPFTSDFVPMDLNSLNNPITGRYCFKVTANLIAGGVEDWYTLNDIKIIKPSELLQTLSAFSLNACTNTPPINYCIETNATNQLLQEYGQYMHWCVDGIAYGNVTSNSFCKSLPYGTYTFQILFGNAQDDLVECITLASKTVNVGPSVSITQITPNNISGCSNVGGVIPISVNIINGTPPYSYAWNNTAGINSTSAANHSLNITQAQTGTYTITVTDWSNCTATAFINVSVFNCCPGSNIIACLNNVNLSYGNVTLSKIYQDICGTSNTINFSTLPANTKITIAGTLTVDGTYTIANSNITGGSLEFSSSGSIEIGSGRSLTISNSYLKSCTTAMWQGIKLASGGNLTVNNNTLIADALVAIGGTTSPLVTIGTFVLSNVRFFRNWVSVNIPLTPSSSSTVNGCTFQYNPSDPLSNYLLSPHNGKRPAVGISINNMSSGSAYWNITNQIGGTPNLFDGLNCGVNVSFSNVRINNNTFNNIRNYNNPGAYAGKAIYCESALPFTTNGANVWVQTNSNLSSNAVFNNNDYGVYVTGANAIVQNNKMQNVSYGIYSASCQFSALNFNANVIDQTLGGITFNSVLGAAALPSAVSNTINVLEPNAFNIVTYGIGHFEVNNSVVSCNGGTRNCRPLIELNNINHGRYGVQINNAYGTRVTNNTITQNNTVSTTQTKAAIFTSGANMPLITLNSITGNGSVYDESANASSANRRSGIRMMNSTAEICNNTFNSIGYATEFIAGCNGTQLKQSQINACRYGVVLKNNGATQGLIGNQGAANLTHGNVFNGPFNNTPSNFRTFCFNSNGSNSPFFVIAPIASQQPEPNGASAGFLPITKQTSTSSTAWACPVFKSLIITEGDLYAKEVAEGDAAEYMEYGFEESGSYMAERDLFNRLEDDHSLLQSQQRYETFYAEKQTDAIGLMKAVDEAIYALTDPSIAADSAAFAAKWQQALDLNNALPSTNVWEQNRKTINNIYLHTAALGIDTFTTAQQQLLYSIAALCPYSDGDAVYAARSLYNIIDHTAFFDDEEICNAVANYKKEQAKKLSSAEFKVTVSPNPTNHFVDIVIKGSTKNALMRVYNTLGEEVGAAEVNNYVQLDVSSFTSGLYLMHFTTIDGKTYSTQIVVTK